MGKTGQYRKTTQATPDQKNGVAPGNKGAEAEQYASQEETSNYNNQSNNNNTHDVNDAGLHNYSLLATTISILSVSFAQVTTPFARRSSSAFVFSLCKHTLTLSLPLGTVGHVIGRTFMPRATRYAESGRGCGVSMGMMGERFGCEVPR